MTYSIYTITHRASSRVYVGITAKRPSTRWSEHGSQAKYYAQRQIRRSPLWMALSEHGHAAFDFEVVDSVATAKEAAIRERQWIVALGLIGVELYNHATGGGLGNPTTRRATEVIVRREERSQLLFAEMIRENPRLGEPTYVEDQPDEEEG